MRYRRSIPLALLLFVVWFSFVCGPVSAQHTTPDGLDMQIEGSDRFAHGQPLRFFITAFEIRHGDEYRPAQGATVRALSSYAPDEALVTQVTDSHGRAMLVFTPPAELTDSFELVFVLRHRGLARHYSLVVSLHRPQVLLQAVHGNVPLELGSDIVTRGLGIRENGEAAAHASWILQTQHLGRIVHEQSVQADAEGAFVGVYRPRQEGSFVVAVVEAGHEEPLAEVGVDLVAPDPSQSQVSINAPSYVLAGERVSVEVMVRDVDRLPLQGALVVGPEESAAQGLGGSLDERERVRTDIQGHATLTWLASAEEAGREIRIRLPGGHVIVRPLETQVVERNVVLSAWPEGGAFVVGAPSYVYIRAASPDGRPLAQHTVEVGSLGFEDQTVVTDNAGFARFETTIQTRDLRRLDSACGGRSAIPVSLRTAEQSVTRVCLAVDTDATLRLRVQRSNRLEIQVFRTPTAQDAPVALSVFEKRDGRDLPLRFEILTGDRHTFELGGSSRTFEVRARSLVGPAQHEVRGGLVRSRPPLRVDAPLNELHGLRVAVDSTLGDRLGSYQPRSALQVEALANRRWQPDQAAPAVLRRGRIISVDAPETPTHRAILRDAWRQRARYRTGRLALIFRAVEQYVDAHGPEGITRREGQRMAFRRGALPAILARASFQAENRLDLGGRPLDLGDLQSLDPTFRFDRVAARISRARLLNILVATRTLVHEHGLDIEVLQRASPEDWWEPLRQAGLTETEDGWGRPFRFMPVRGAARYRAVDPVRGFELVSAGPDGVYGNRDDIWDPSAPVLAAGSLYALAMDESTVVAELRGGAAGLGLISEGADLVEPERRSRSRTRQARSQRARVRVLGTQDEVASVPFSGAAEWSLVNIQRHAGRWRFSRRQVHAPPESARLLTRFPDRIEAGETLCVPLVFLGGTGGIGREAAEVTVRLSAEGLDVALEGETSGVLSEIQPFQTVLVLSANADLAEQDANIEVVLTTGDQEVLTRTIPIRVSGGDVRHSLTAGHQLAAGERWRVQFDAPPGAEAFVVVSPTERPSQDPQLQIVLRRHPALLAWALVLDGERPSPALMRRLLVERATTPLEAACALVALAASAPSDDSEATLRTRNERQEQLESTLDLFVRERSDRRGPGYVGESAAVLSALSSVALARSDDPQSRHRSLNALMHRLRARLRPATGPRYDAFVAAALLLVDREDLSGMSAWLRASRFEGDRPSETLMAYYLARYLSTGQRSRLTDAEVRRTAMVRHTPVSLFWHLVAAGRGTFGAQRTGHGHVLMTARGEEPIELDLDAHQEVDFTTQDADGATAVRLELTAERPVFARVEARFRRGERNRQEMPVALTLEGHAGTLTDGGALELTLVAEEDVSELTLAIGLPSGLDSRPLVRELRTADGVENVGTPDRSGQLLLRLAAMSAGETRRVAIPLRWLASGERRGMSVGLWQTLTPWQITSLAATPLEVGR